ncbi:modifier of mdg4 isoform X9 [Cryptotermes secundus]|uniref:modifier of mdg4 isoform X9 n=1 Tax=Cryptotermes secundus TaxID=105785 RepID=UPI001454DD79|nr:modifier of mdg4 isoform X9 [Cryptotermes secundus]
MSEGESDQFSLRWNNFHSNLTSGFHALLQGEDLVDVTLAAGGQFVQAHKIVLSVCSPYFKDLFKVNPCKHPIVILKDVCHKDLVAILQFMYRGEVNVRQEELATFLKTAEMLQIKGLTGEDSPIEEDITPVPQPSVRTRAPRRVSEKSLHGTPEKKETVANPVTAEPEEASAPPYKRMKPEVSSAVLSSPVITEESSGVEFIEMTNPKQEPVEYETEIEEVNRLQNRDDPLVQLLGGESSQTLQDSSQGSSIFASIPSASQDSGLPQDCGQDGMWHQYRKFFCVICTKSFKLKKHLTVHMKNLHGELKGPFRCNICDQISKNSESLRKHVAYMHAWSRPSKMKEATSEISSYNFK